jgi:hypothetical protein
MKMNPKRIAMLVPVFLGGVVTSGCHKVDAPKTDPTSMQRYSDEMKRQHQLEMQNREPDAGKSSP